MKILRKTSSESVSTPTETGLFRKSRFSVETEQAHEQAEEHEMPNLQTQLDRAARFRQKLSQMKVHGNRPLVEPKIFGHQGTEYQQGNSLVSQQLPRQAEEIEAASPLPRQLQTNSLQPQSQPQEEEESPVQAQAESTQLQGQAKKLPTQTLILTNAEHLHNNKAKQNALEGKEEVRKSDKPKLPRAVEIVSQQKQSPSAVEATAEAKVQGGTNTAAKAIQAVNPQQQVKLPQKEVKAQAKGEHAKGKDGNALAGQGEGKALEQLPQAKAHKQATAHHQAASHKSETADLKPEADNQHAKAAAEQGKAQLEATNVQAQQLASAGVTFALPKEEKAGDVQQGAVIARKAENPNGDSAFLEKQSARASSVASSFLATASGKVQTITGLGTGIPGRILGAAETAKASVMGVVEQEKAAVTAHIAQERAKAQSEAQATITKIQTQYQATIAAIPKETAKARQKVESEYTTSTKVLDEREKSQITQIEQIYARAANEFRSAGARVGDEAIRIANQKANEYRSRDSGAAQFASNIGLGSISDVAFGTDTLKNKARAQAAEQVGQAYKQGLIDKANECAQQAQQGKKKDIDTVHQTATKSRETLKNQHKTALESLNAAEQQAKQQAQQMQTQLTEAAHQSLQATLTSLDQQQTTQPQKLIAQGQQQMTSIEGSAQHAISSLQNAIHQSASGLQKTLQTFQAKSKTVQAPDPDALSAAVAQALGQIDAEVGKIQAQVEQGIAASVQSITQSSQQSVATFTAIGQGAVETVTTLSQGFTTTMTGLAKSGTDTFTKIQESYKNTTTQTTTTAVDGFKKVTEGIHKTFDEMNKGLESQFQQNVKGIEKGLRGALDKLPGDIEREAEKAAAKVDPKKELLKLILIVAVVLVVALVIGPFAAGLLAPLGTLGTILAGAAVGALSAAAIQMGNNIIDGNRGLDIFQGVGQAALIGALTGALGAGIGIGLDQVAAKFGAEAVKSFAGKLALDVGKNFVNDIALNISTGQFNWDNIGQSLLLAVLTAGVTNSRIGKSIHQGNYGKGVDVGDSINSGIKKTFGGLSGDRTPTDISKPSKTSVVDETTPSDKALGGQSGDRTPTDISTPSKTSVVDQTAPSDKALGGQSGDRTPTDISAPPVGGVRGNDVYEATNTYTKTETEPDGTTTITTHGALKSPSGYKEICKILKGLTNSQDENRPLIKDIVQGTPGQPITFKVEIPDSTPGQPPHVVKVTVEPVHTADLTPGAHGPETGPARMDLQPVTAASVSGKWTARIELDSALHLQDLPHIIGHEVNELVGIVSQYPTGATTAELNEQMAPGVFRDGSTATKPTAHDMAAVQELRSLYENENNLLKNKASLDQNIARRKKSIENTLKWMGLNEPTNIDVKLKVLREAGLSQYVINEVKLLVAGAELQTHTNAAGGTSTIFDQKVVSHLMFPEDPGSTFSGSGINGGHDTQRLLGFANDHESIVVVEQSSKAAGGTTFHKYDQYKWKGQLPKPGAGDSRLPGGRDFNSTDWVKPRYPKTTADDVQALMREANAGWENLMSTRVAANPSAAPPGSAADGTKFTFGLGQPAAQAPGSGIPFGGYATYKDGKWVLNTVFVEETWFDKP